MERLERDGDQFQYGGPHLCAGWKFATPDGKAHFTSLWPRAQERPSGSIVVSTRRGKQFNSMVQEAEDPLTGAGRDAIFMCEADARALELGEGDPAALVNTQGRLRGRIHLAPVAPGTCRSTGPRRRCSSPAIPPRAGPSLAFTTSTRWSASSPSARRPR
jgi:anaerobic selenocysteine-containing dehydrogenase